MSLAEEVSEEEQELMIIGNVLRNLISRGDYLGVLGYYFVLGKEYQDFVKNDTELNAMLDLAIDEAPYQKAHY